MGIEAIRPDAPGPVPGRNGTGTGHDGHGDDRVREIGVRSVVGPGGSDGSQGTARREELAALVSRMLELLGEEPTRPGLRDTPQRVARSLSWLTRGNGQDPAAVVGRGIFDESHDELVLVRDIEVYSLCEHHMLPFYGRAHVGYLPNGRIIGLSKVARVVEACASRLQVQERLTADVADTLDRALSPRGVGVVLECDHLCMRMRGVRTQGGTTTTRALRGVLRECPGMRQEFLAAVGRRAG